MGYNVRTRHIARHIAAQYVQDAKGGNVAEMTAEAKAARAAYMREWRKRNPEKVKEYDAQRWQHVADREAEKEAAQCHETTND